MKAQIKIFPKKKNLHKKKSTSHFKMYLWLIYIFLFLWENQQDMALLNFQELLCPKSMIPGLKAETPKLYTKKKKN